jgi:hypothetical protein
MFSVKNILFLIVFFISKTILAQTCASEMSTFLPQNTEIATYRTGVLKIPVVVHVVYNEDVENISDEQIFSQIEVLNNDFRQKNDQSKLPSEFKKVAADVEIEFYLAQISPKGKPTTGISRIKTGSKEVWQEKAMLNGIQKRKVYFTNIEGDDAWDTQKYLNIWVCKMPDGKSGYSTFPNQIKSDESDGIVIDYRFFGTKGVAATNQPFHKGRTSTHEIGHFLNIQHVWGASIGKSDCSEDDGIADTPSQSGPVSGCPSGTVSHCGKSVMFQNFMNYTHDDCMSIFTLGQKQKMTETLMTFRNNLANNSIATFDTQLTDIQVFPNPVNDFLNIKMNQNGQYFLVNMQGQIVAKNELLAGNNQIDMLNFSNGFYQIGIIVGTTQINKKINLIH